MGISTGEPQGASGACLDVRTTGESRPAPEASERYGEGVRRRRRHPDRGWGRRSPLWPSSGAGSSINLQAPQAHVANQHRLHTGNARAQIKTKDRRRRRAGNEPPAHFACRSSNEMKEREQNHIRVPPWAMKQSQRQTAPPVKYGKQGGGGHDRQKSPGKLQ